MEALHSDSCCKLYVHPIITELSDFAKFFGGETETIVNSVQRSFKSIHRQCERLTARAMLHDVFGRFVEISYTPEGKPLLDTAGIAVSISHSKTHVAILLSTQPCAGVDIEVASPRILSLGQRVAAPEELPNDYDLFDEERKVRALTALWTAKEAAYKSLDAQAGINMLSDIRVTAYNEESNLPSEVSVKEHGGLCLKSFELQDNICTFTNHSITQQYGRQERNNVK
jgi:4'-phosphopantetheinyl transferase